MDSLVWIGCGQGQHVRKGDATSVAKPVMSLEFVIWLSQHIFMGCVEKVHFQINSALHLFQIIILSLQKWSLLLMCK